MEFVMGEARAVSLLDGRRVREELRRVGIKSQVDLAAEVGVRPEEISRALNGAPISPDLMFRIAITIALKEPVR
jgi:plasmid maintenance system antidote protein VapI